MREWKGLNAAAFEGEQRHAVDAASIQLYELSKAIKLLSENRQPTQGGSTPVVGGGGATNAVTDGDKGDIEVTGSGATWTVETAAGFHFFTGTTIAELQALCDSLTSGGTIFLGPGTYTVAADTPLTLNNPDIRIVGVAANTVLINCLDYDTDIIRIRNTVCTLENINVFHGTTGHSNGAGGVGHGRGIVIDMETTSADHLSGPTLRNVAVTNTASWCIYSTGVYSYDDISYSDGFSLFNTTFCAAGAGGPRTAAEELKWPFPIWGLSGALSTTYSIVSATTINSKTVTSAALFANVRVGQYVYGTGIPHATRVVAKASNSSITISNKATATGGPTLEFKRTTNCRLTVEMHLDQVTVAYANSGGALYLGYGGTTTKASGLKTNCYSYGSVCSHFHIPPTDAVTLGAVHDWGGASDVFDNKPIFQSPGAQTGTPDVPHDDTDATMFSFAATQNLHLEAAYHEVLSTYCEDGRDWYHSVPPAPAGYDQYGYRQYWTITSPGGNVHYTNLWYDARTQKKDPADVGAGYDQGFPLRLFRTCADAGTTIRLDGGSVAHHRRYYSAALGRDPAGTPFESGDFYPIPENGTVTTDPWDTDDLLLLGSSDGTIENPIIINGFKIHNRGTGKTRDLCVPTAIGINNREVFQLNAARLIRAGAWEDNDPFLIAPSVDDMRVRTAFSQDFRGGQLAYVRGTGGQSISCDLVNGNTTINATVADAFINVSVGMRISNDFGSFPSTSTVQTKPSNSQITVDVAPNETNTRVCKFWTLGGKQRDGWWGVSSNDNDWRHIAWTRKHVSPWTNAVAGDTWYFLSGTPVASVYPNAQLNWYSAGAWQAAFGLPRTTTAAGDLAYYTASDTPARLAIGSARKVLMSVSGAPSWQTPDIDMVGSFLSMGG